MECFKAGNIKGNRDIYMQGRVTGARHSAVSEWHMQQMNGGECMKIYCNNKNCIFNKELECTCHTVYYIERLCMTFRSRRRENNAHKLMQGESRPGCHRVGGKYRSDNARVIR